jgi:hypothetical protein
MVKWVLKIEGTAVRMLELLALQLLALQLLERWPLDQLQHQTN